VKTTQIHRLDRVHIEPLSSETTFSFAVCRAPYQDARDVATRTTRTVVRLRRV